MKLAGKPTIPPTGRYTSNKSTRKTITDWIMVLTLVAGIIVAIVVMGIALKRANYHIFYEDEVRQTIQEMVKESSLK